MKVYVFRGRKGMGYSPDPAWLKNKPYQTFDRPEDVDTIIAIVNPEDRAAARARLLELLSN